MKDWRAAVSARRSFAIQAILRKMRADFVNECGVKND